MTMDMYNQSAFLIIKIAHMYYMENYSQRDIADKLKISITTVSRLLKKAKDDRIVEFVIRDPYVECISLETALKEAFDLKEVIIAPGFRSEAGEHSYDADDEEIKKLVALEGARYLQRIIRPKDVLGVTWGSTIYQMINYLNPAQKVDATFVTLHGSIACCKNELDVRTLVSRMAKAFSGKHYYLLTEALMSTKQAADIIKQEKNNQIVFRMFKNINISINGTGSFYPELNSVLSKPEFMSKEELNMLLNESAVGDISLRFFNKDGKECNTELSDRMIAIDFEQFKKIDTKITIASGAYKAYTILSALKGKLIDVLIVDYLLGKKIMELYQKNDR